MAGLQAQYWCGCLCCTASADSRNGADERMKIPATWAKQTVAGLLICFAAFVSAPASAAPVTSITQWGITWTFDKAYESGQYANGDYWVLGPVVITDITPRSSTVNGRVINGTQVNPNSTKHGYDSIPAEGGNQYSDSLNVAPAKTGQSLRVSTGSVVSSISVDSPKSPPRPAVKTLAVLTVVSSVPVPGSFRPGPYGTDKNSYWQEKNLDYSILHSLAPVLGTPSLSEVTNSARRFWNEQDTWWTARTIHASDNQQIYGREIANASGHALLSLHLNYSNAQKRDLFVYLVQQGIDLYDRAVVGGNWQGEGGHDHGRKMMMVLAGVALNDPKILEMADGARHYIFQEDKQTFYISAADVGRARYTADGRKREPYTSAMIGTPEWGEQRARAPERDASNWDAPYRWVGSQFMAHALMAQLTRGAVEAWNWKVFFDYTDRYEKLGGPEPTGANSTPTFTQQMWTAYRNKGVTAGGKSAGVSKPQAPTLTGVE